MTLHLTLTFTLADVHPDLAVLMQRAADRRATAFRPGTSANHQRYMRSYVAFCLTYQIDDLDPSPAQLSAYVEFLLHSGIATRTVSNFLAGVRHYLQAAGMNDQALSSYTLGLTLRSLKISFEAPPNRKRPFTLEQVRRLADYCQLRGLLGFTLKLAIVLGFFGLLRISNLVPPTVTLLHGSGATLDDIKRQGLWRSQAVNQYIQDNTLAQSSVIDAFGAAINDGASTSNTHTPPRPAKRRWNAQTSNQRRHRSPKAFKKGPNSKNKHFRKKPPRRD